MKKETLVRYTGVVAIAAALALAFAGVATLGSGGGLDNPLAPISYYVALVLMVPTYMGLYAVQYSQAGRLGFVGFALGIAGAILYSAPAYVLVAGTSGVAAWHDVWFFAMGRGLLLPVGPTLFLVGSIMLGIATRRAGILPRVSGALLALGSFLWLIAFWLSAFSPLVGALLPIGNVMSAVALVLEGRVLLAPAGHDVQLATS